MWERGVKSHVIYILSRYFQSRLLQFCCIWKRVKETPCESLYWSWQKPWCFPRNPENQALPVLTLSHIQQICSRQLGKNMETLFNPFPHINAFWRFCSRQIFENIVTKEKIAQNKQFLLLTQCFQLLVIGHPFNYRDFPFCWQKMFKVVCCRIVIWGKG